MPMAVKPAADTQMNLKKSCGQGADRSTWGEGGGGGEKSSDMIDSTWYTCLSTPSQSEIFWLKAVIVACSYGVSFQDQYTLPKWNILTESCYCGLFVWSFLSGPVHPPKVKYSDWKLLLWLVCMEFHFRTWKKSQTPYPLPPHIAWNWRLDLDMCHGKVDCISVKKSKCRAVGLGLSLRWFLFQLHCIRWQIMHNQGLCGFRAHITWNWSSGDMKRIFTSGSMGTQGGSQILVTKCSLLGCI